MLLLINVLKGFNNSQGSKSKATTRWIVVKVSHLNNVLFHVLKIKFYYTSVNFEYLNILFNLV